MKVFKIGNYNLCLLSSEVFTLRNARRDLETNIRSLAEALETKLRILNNNDKIDNSFLIDLDIRTIEDYIDDIKKAMSLFMAFLTPAQKKQVELDRLKEEKEKEDWAADDYKLLSNPYFRMEMLKTKAIWRDNLEKMREAGLTSSNYYDDKWKQWRGGGETKEPPV